MVSNEHFLPTNFYMNSTLFFNPTNHNQSFQQAEKLSVSVILIFELIGWIFLIFLIKRVTLSFNQL